MNRSISLIISLLIAVVLALGAYQFFQTHEYKEVTKRTGFLGEARSNPLYATRLFLKQMGIPTHTKESLQSITQLPDTDTLLLLNTKRTTLSPEKIDDLINWIESGGHLITKASDDWKSSEKLKNDDDSVDDNNKEIESIDPLQRFLGVRTSRGEYLNELEDSFDQLEGLVGESLEEIGLAENIKTIKLAGVDKKLALKDLWFRDIQVRKNKRSITEQIQLGNSNYIIRQKVGNGLVTLVSDMRFIENKAIDVADHAEILWHLIHGLQASKQQPAAIWLIHNDKMPNLFSLLWKYAWAFIISLTLLLLAWILTSTRRFGPLIPKEQENRRSLKEHIISSGNYYWKNNDRKKLLESSRHALLQRLSRTHPGWSQRDQQEQASLIAEQTDNKPEAIYKLLFSEDINLIKNAEQFTDSIRQIEQIRKSI